MPIRSWNDKVAVVTGAAHGLGAALARGFAARGARVVALDRDPAVAALAGALGAGHEHRVVDVADAAAVQAAADDIAARHGAVHVLVNNAGVAVAGRFEQVPQADFEWLMGVNFWGVVHGCRAFLPHLRRTGGGQIVNVASSFAWLGFPGKSAYAAAKAAVRALSESLRGELAGSGIGVTVLYPGPLDTRLVADGRAVDPAQRTAEAELLRRRAIPLDRVVARTIRGIERDRARVVVGLDYRLLDAAARLAPSITLAAIARMARRLPF